MPSRGMAGDALPSCCAFSSSVMCDTTSAARCSADKEVLRNADGSSALTCMPDKAIAKPAIVTSVDAFILVTPEYSGFLVGICTLLLLINNLAVQVDRL